jgi:hypothetical protein
MTEYYDVTRIQRRHKILLQNPNFSMAAGMLENGAHEEPVFFKTGKRTRYQSVRITIALRLR